jgi:copper chaperone NosL
VTKLSRGLVALASLLMIGMYFFPIWRIQLGAPQYPEGLGMLIWIDNVGGIKPHDLDNINGLNHYIGMPPIEADAIPELRVLPWLIGGLIAFGLIAAALGRRKVVIAWVSTVIVAGLVGLADFYRWGYNFGHNLDFENAIIKIPGMAYQPPLFGTKQLLNFTATSWPDVGAILAGVAVMLGLAAIFLTRKRATGLMMAATVAAVTACASAGPPQVHYGEENCAQCRMTISDPRFGASVVTGKGKVLKFDSVECAASYMASADSAGIREVWVSDYSSPGSFVPAQRATFIRTKAVSSPMGSGILALGTGADVNALRLELGGELLEWETVVALSKDGHTAGAAGHGTHSH